MEKDVGGPPNQATPRYAAGRRKTLGMAKRDCYLYNNKKTQLTGDLSRS